MTTPTVRRVPALPSGARAVPPWVGCYLIVVGVGVALLWLALGKLLDRVTVANGQGDEFDIGELTTYLNDAILLAPSMLLGPATSWNAVDDGSFDVSFTDAGRTVRGRVFVDKRGAPYEFSTTDRYTDLPGGLTRAEWRTPVKEWDIVDGRAVPGRFGALWRLPDGPLPYVTGQLTHLTHNAAPGR